jgi:hypothetical protein
MLGAGLRQANFRADESEVSRLGLQYAVRGSSAARRVVVPEPVRNNFRAVRFSPNPQPPKEANSAKACRRHPVSVDRPGTALLETL